MLQLLVPLRHSALGSRPALIHLGILVYPHLLNLPELLCSGSLSFHPLAHQLIQLFYLLLGFLLRYPPRTDEFDGRGHRTSLLIVIRQGDVEASRLLALAAHQGSRTRQAPGMAALGRLVEDKLVGLQLLQVLD